jgi:hypothetical protein
MLIGAVTNRPRDQGKQGVPTPTRARTAPARSDERRMAHRMSAGGAWAGGDSG